MHDSPQWTAIAPYLPNRLTATPEVLEEEGDILRARRFIEDANAYYNFAFQVGGRRDRLLDKLGLTQLEMHDIALARAYFSRVVKINGASAQGWNNLGVVEYLSGRPLYAIANFERAIRLDGQRAIYHHNLATAYLDRNDLSSARKEIQKALAIDPKVFDRLEENASEIAQVISRGGHARFAFELARLYARDGDEEQMMHSLAISSEAGMDLRQEMRRDKVLSRYVKDPRVTTLLQNTDALHADGGRRSGVLVGALSPKGKVVEVASVR